MTLILWSGGCDSTLVLADRLLERAAGDRTETIRTIAFNYDDQITASAKQRAVRMAIATRLASLGLSWDEHIEIGFRLQEGSGFLQHGNPQFALWLNALQCLEPDEDLVMGYNHEDALEPVGSANSVVYAIQYASCRTGTLRLPLINMRKRWVLERLEDLALADLVWWCQYGDERPCGKCHSCILYETAQWQRQRWPSAGGG